MLLVSIGEMESKEDCSSQLGIYAVGKFSLQSNRRKKLVGVAVYKKTAMWLCVVSLMMTL